MPTPTPTGGQVRGAQRSAARATRRHRLRELLDAGRQQEALLLDLGIGPAQLRADLRAIGEAPRKAGRKPASSAQAKES